MVFPSTLPFLLTGLRIAVGRALVGLLAGELYAATAGIGFMITVAGATFQTDKVFVGVLIFAISGIVLTDILDRIEHRFDKWRPRRSRRLSRIELSRHSLDRTCGEGVPRYRHHQSPMTGHKD